MYMFRDTLPRINGSIRFLHAIPDAPNVDIYANGKLLYSNISFGSITNYISISPQTYNIELYKTGTYDTPLISESTEITPNSITTLIISYSDKEISYFTIDDSHAQTNPLLSFIRFINLAPNAPLLSLELPDDTILFNQTSYLETNDYYPTSPGIYNFVVSTADGQFDKFISNVNLTKNLFITIYIIGIYKGIPPLGYILVKDGLNKSRLQNI